MTDDLTITVKDVDIDAWKRARKLGIDRGITMGEVVTLALEMLIKSEEEKKED